jgi:hypothetical protein
MDSEFSERPLIAGNPLVGLRAFRVNEHAHLTGVFHEQIWTPGENLADCYLNWHQGIALKCTCGFYAYTNGKNSYAAIGTVAGIIEGYGRMVIGTDGFRCEKARLVALVRLGHITALRWFNIACAALQTMFLVSYLISAKWQSAALTVLFIAAPLLYLLIPRRSVSREAFQCVHDNYPDVPVYRSVRAAVAAHPLTPTNNLLLLGPA